MNTTNTMGTRYPFGALRAARKMGVPTIPQVEKTEEPDAIFTYESFSNGSISVFRNDKLIGRIESANGIYQYVTRTGEYGEVYTSVDEAKQAIEQYK